MDVKKRLRRILGREQQNGTPMQMVRAHPAQKYDAVHMLYAPEPRLVPLMVQYALNNWVGTAVSYMARKAASANLQVVERKNETSVFDGHGLLGLLGEYGNPNDNQDSYEFWEGHFTLFDMAGNSFWWWESGMDGLPGEVHHLNPTHVRIIPGSRRSVANYVYTAYGHEIPLDPIEVTHWRRFSPFSSYWGMSAVQMLMATVKADTAMAEWNLEFFGEEISMPAGIMVIPKDVSDADRDRIADELTGKHGGQRRTAVVRSDPGAAMWHDAGLKPKDMDFGEGRMLTRRSVYEAFDIPLGIMSEASTEANATVAQRQLADAIALRHLRGTRKLNADAMPFWPGHKKYVAKFEDVRRWSVDWRQESLRLNTIAPKISVNEFRAEIGKAPIPGGDDYATALGVEGGLRRDEGSEELDGGASGAPRGTGRTGDDR